MNKEHKKAVGYTRVSTSIQAKEGESLSTQKQQIEEYAKSKGWKLDHIYSDEGISGAKIEFRTDFKRLIQDAKQGKFDIVIFTKLSRFARNTREYLNLFHELQEYGITLVSIKENVDPTTPTGRAMATMLASFAEWERETIKEQMYENKIVRWSEQRIFNGMPPYGYYWNKETKKLEINTEEAEVYNMIVDMYLNQKMSFQDICLKLKEQGIKGKRAYFSSITIGYMLKNPAYYGKYVVNQYIYEDGPNGAGTRRTKKRKQSSEHITFQIPPLISKNQWEQIQSQIQFNKIKSKRSTKTKDLTLRDVLICGRCGGRVKPRVGNARKDGTVPLYYVCYWAGTSEKNLLASGRNKKCSLPFIKTKDIEKQIWSDIWVLLSLNPNKAFDNLFDSDKLNNKMVQLKERLTKMESELSKKELARDNLYKLMEEEAINLIDIKDRLVVNQDEILSIESKINDKRQELRELENLTIKEQDISIYIKNNKKELRKIITDLRRLNSDDRKLFVESMLSGKVIVNYQEDNKWDGPGGATARFKLKWNISIIQRFFDEGKIANFNKNSTFYSS